MMLFARMLKARRAVKSIHPCPNGTARLVNAYDTKGAGLLPAAENAFRAMSNKVYNAINVFGDRDSPQGQMSSLARHRGPQCQHPENVRIVNAARRCGSAGDSGSVADTGRGAGRCLIRLSWQRSKSP